MLVRIVVHLGVFGEWLVLKVRIMQRVFLQVHKVFLELKYVYMIGVDLFDRMLVLFGDVGM